MFAALIAVVLLVGGLAVWWLLRRARTLRSTAQIPRRAQGLPAALPPLPAQPAPADLSPALPLPDDPRLVRWESLEATRRQALLEELRQIPRPPRALQQLVSHEFLARASSNELAELVMTEPMVAARVMAAVNSPLYGLRKPVTSVGQAITFLGLNTVRNLCLQHLLRDTMPTTDPVLRREFDILWDTSAIASELCLVLAKRLQLPDAAGMSTQLVLHFLGRFAVAALAKKQGCEVAPQSMVARMLTEQQQLGLSAGEIGTMLMQEWRLPDGMVQSTRDISRVAFLQPPAPDTRYAARLALCALCASLGERIARKELTALELYDPAGDPHDDLRVLGPHLSTAILDTVGEALREPDRARLLLA